MKKVNKLVLCIHIALFVSGLITKHYNLPINKLFASCLWISSIIIFIYSIHDILECYKEKKKEKKEKSWIMEHMYIIPESREVVITVNSQLEKWQEDIISKVEKAASEEGLKVTVNSPLSEVIDNYYS